MIFMKLFACKNPNCESNVPNDAKSNNIKEAIVSLHSLDSQGDTIETSNPRIKDIYYVCGNCGDDAKKVPYSEVMDIDFIKRDGDWVLGEYENWLRGAVYEFKINIFDGRLKMAGLEPRDLEIDYIKEKFKESYIGQIEAEVVDVKKDKFSKVYEVVVENPIEERLGTVEVNLDDDEVKVFNEELKDFEIKQAKKAARRSIY